MKKPVMYQMFSRMNDINGNAYRMALLYSKDGVVIDMLEERTSKPNFQSELQVPALPTISLTRSEYNQLKKYALIMIKGDL